MNKIAKIALGLVIFGFSAFIITGFINLNMKRNILPIVNNSSQFSQVSFILQNKCVDCHSPNMTDYPFYFKLPIASSIIAHDIHNAQSHFFVTKNELIGKEKFSALQLNKLQRVVLADAMPPNRYKLLHWNSFLTDNDRKVILTWIDSQKNTTQLISSIPNVNPFNPNKDKVKLGKALFFDTRLSGNNTISCASCHSLAKGGTDNLKYSQGINGQLGGINAPTVFNSAFNFAQFWDGRARDLNEQANGPINNPIEMGSNWKQVLSKLIKDQNYLAQFGKLYKTGMNPDSITDAIATYEKSLLTPDSRFDRYLNGDTNALDKDEVAGYKLFINEGCVSCHNGVNLGSNSYQKMGVAENYFEFRGSITKADYGRYNVTKQESDKYFFKVPTLRNIALTYPYFHDGSINDLNQAVKYMARFQLGKTMSDKDSKLIVRFLDSLTGNYDNKALTTR